MPNEKERVYWDSCVFIDLLQQRAGRYEACRYIHDRAEKGELLIVTSAITIAEVVKLPESGTFPDMHSKMILEYFENPYIVIRQVDRPTAEEAHRLSQAHGIYPMDAIHLATALGAVVSVLHTYDEKKKRRKGLLGWNLKVGNPPLRIEKPADPPPPPPPPPAPPVEESLFAENDLGIEVGRQPPPGLDGQAAPSSEPKAEVKEGG